MSTVIQIVTSSQVINYSPTFPNFPAAQLPKITINGTAIAAPQAPNTPTGYQVVVFNAAMNITDPNAIIANVCLPVFPSNGNNWMGTYQYVYQNICTTLLNAGNIQEQTIIVASYGMDGNMPPTNDGLEMFLNYGANGQLQYWEQHCDAGPSRQCDVLGLVPVSYILFGASGLGYGTGSEIYQSQAGPATLTVTL